MEARTDSELCGGKESLEILRLSEHSQSTAPLNVAGGRPLSRTVPLLGKLILLRENGEFAPPTFLAYRLGIQIVGKPSNLRFPITIAQKPMGDRTGKSRPKAQPAQTQQHHRLAAEGESHECANPHHDLKIVHPQAGTRRSLPQGGSGCFSPGADISWRSVER